MCISDLVPRWNLGEDKGGSDVSKILLRNAKAAKYLHLGWKCSVFLAFIQVAFDINWLFLSSLVILDTVKANWQCSNFFDGCLKMKTIRHSGWRMAVATKGKTLTMHLTADLELDEKNLALTFYSVKIIVLGYGLHYIELECAAQTLLPRLYKSSIS